MLEAAELLELDQLVATHLLLLIHLLVAAELVDRGTTLHSLLSLAALVVVRLAEHPTHRLGLVVLEHLDKDQMEELGITLAAITLAVAVVAALAAQEGMVLQHPQVKAEMVALVLLG